MRAALLPPPSLDTVVSRRQPRSRLVRRVAAGVSLAASSPGNTFTADSREPASTAAAHFPLRLLSLAALRRHWR
ncbi:hypothetical protein PF003_g15195 [Phytophthora fragariae]|nr:hypothetical protein PF003_g15195 [Phytophthora fragariae]